MRVVSLLIVTCLVGNALCGKRGIKQRAYESESEPDLNDDAPEPSSSFRATGGIRRRMEGDKVMAGKTKPIAKVPLMNWAKQEWAKGKLTTGQCQQMVVKAAESGTPGMEGMAAMGNSGKNTQNLFRAMKNLLGYPEHAPPLSWIEVPTKKGRRTPQPVFWPHDYLRSLSAEHFGKRLLGPANASLQFWESMRGSPYLDNHPSLPETAWAKTIPIGIHGDGGSFSKQDNIYVLSFNSLVANYGPTLDTRLIFTIMRKSDMVCDTMDQLLEALSW
jgi:hypothetical protein